MLRFATQSAFGRIIVRMDDPSIDYFGDGEEFTPEHPYEHIVRPDDPEPGPPEPDAMRAAIARVVRRHSKSFGRFIDVFGIGTAAHRAVSEHIDALRAALDDSEPFRTSAILDTAARLHALLTWLSAVCSVLETRSESAAALHVDIGALITECELLLSVERIAA